MGATEPQVGDAIVVRDLVYAYPKSTTPAVNGISFTCPAGTTTALLGPNGAGKSTTMDLLSSARVPTSGSITLDGFDSVRQPKEARRHAAFLFQYRALGTWLTTEETVRLGVAMVGRFSYRLAYRWMPADYRDEIERLATMLELRDALHVELSKLSGGQKRKVELLRALMMRPRILFLDEPTVGLDPNARRGVWQHILGLRRASGLTVFVSTHYLDEAEDVDNVLVLARGKLIAQGTPADLRRRFARTRVVLDGPDVAELRRAAESLGLVADGAGPVSVELGALPLADFVREFRAPYTHLEVDQRRLEDAYFSLTGGANT